MLKMAEVLTKRIFCHFLRQKIAAYLIIKNSHNSAAMGVFVIMPVNPKLKGITC